MPFTLSHVAAVLPFRRLNLVWSAFVVGSMAPDFPYIVGSTDYRGLGHEFPGVIEFTLPASILALWLFHVAIKRPACNVAAQQGCSRDCEVSSETSSSAGLPFRGYLVFHRARHRHASGVGYIYPSAQLAMVAVGLAAEGGESFRLSDYVPMFETLQYGSYADRTGRLGDLGSALVSQDAAYTLGWGDTWHLRPAHRPHHDCGGYGGRLRTCLVGDRRTEEPRHGRHLSARLRRHRYCPCLLAGTHLLHNDFVPSNLDDQLSSKRSP